MSREKKYTPGPWKYDGTVIRCGDDKVWFNQSRNINEIEANAYLCAAAPDLLEAMEGLIDSITDYPFVFNGDQVLFMGKAISAIAKAYGEEAVTK